MNTTSNTQALIRSELWQRQLEENLYEHLTGTPWVRQIDFPDGESMTFPSIGTSLVRDLPEGTEVTFDAMDVGEQSMTLDEPVVAATSVSEKLMEDSMWSADLLSRIPTEHATAIMERFESDVLALANAQSAGTGNVNAINGVDHRTKGKGTGAKMGVEDFAYARYALNKAKVPNNNLIAIVDPSVAYTLETATNLVNVSNNPKWEGIIETGIEKNMRFVRNVFGFDIYESNMLPATTETLDGETFTNGVSNIFMSAGRESLLPFAVAWKRRPKLDRDFDFKTREEQIVTTARWGKKVIRDDNLIVTVTDATV